jgi:hypothetical protein
MFNKLWQRGEAFSIACHVFDDWACAGMAEGVAVGVDQAEVPSMEGSTMTLAQPAKCAPRSFH